MTCTATDADDRNSPVTATFTVTVRDTDLALHNMPANVTTNAIGPTGAVATYTPPSAVDEGSETPTVGCLPASGSLFAVGTTTVTCTATDADDLNSPVTATFTVTVKGGLAQLQDLVTTVGALPSSSAKSVLNVQLGDAVAAEQANKTSRVCMDLLGVVRTAQQEQSYGQLTAVQAQQIIAAANQIGTVVGCSQEGTARTVVQPAPKHLAAKHAASKHLAPKHPAPKHRGHQRHRGTKKR